MSNTIDWSHPQKRTRYVRGKPRSDTYYRVTCGCGNERWLRKYDALKAGQCFQCSQKDKARLGYEAVIAKHGRLAAIEKVREYRLNNPSSLEQQIILALNSLDIQYKREVIMTHPDGVHLIDFVVGGCAIEVNGEWVHCSQKMQDAHKHERIRKNGYRLLVLEEHDVPNAAPILSHFLNLSESNLQVQL